MHPFKTLPIFKYRPNLIFIVGNMFGTFKKIIKPKKEEEKKPILKLDEPKKEDFSLPRPEEVRDLPVPRIPTRDGRVSEREEPVPGRESIPRRPLEPPPMKPLNEEPRRLPPPRYGEERRYREDILQEILRRLDEIEGRIARIEDLLSRRAY